MDERFVKIKEKISVEKQEKELIENLNTFFKGFYSCSIKFVYNETTTVCMLGVLENDGDWNEDKPQLFKGVAKLSPDDIYDKKKGEDIAFNKAMEKVIKHYNKVGQRLMKMSSFFFERFEKILVKSYLKYGVGQVMKDLKKKEKKVI
jgi:hypothetical protein